MKLFSVFARIYMRALKRHITFQLFAFAILFVLVLTLTGVLLVARIEDKKQLTSRPATYASGGACSGGPDDYQGCTNGGDLRNGCNWICNSPIPPGVSLVQPSCCTVLAQTGDPFACCFDARRRCTPQQCAAIPDGVIKQRCGQLWELGYCSGSNNNPSPTARPTSPLPSRTPTPTHAPTRRPSRTPTPTKRVDPTDNPNRVNSPTPTQAAPTSSLQPSTVVPTTPFQTGRQQKVIPTTVFQTNRDNFPSLDALPVVFTLPHIRLPKINVVGPVADSVETVDRQLPRTLDFFEYVFGQITRYDEIVEEKINERIDSLLDR